MNEDRRPAVDEPLTPVLRLTGEQIGSIQPPPDGDWFVDFDEYEEFVPKRLLDAARAAAPGLDVERLARAMDVADPSVDGGGYEEEDHAEHLAYAKEIAAEYARLAEEARRG